MKPANIAEWTQREVGTLIHSIARYTRFVHSTKVALGALVLILTAILLFYSLGRNETAGVRIAFTSVVKGAVSPTQMLNARFHGLDKSNQPFNVTAATAVQRDSNTIDLVKVTGDISLKGGIWLSVTANNGVLHLSDRLLDLNGDIAMFNDEGYEFHTESLRVDIGRKYAVSQKPVQGQGPSGTLKAQGVIMDGIRQVTTFTGPVRMIIYPPQ